MFTVATLQRAAMLWRHNAVRFLLASGTEVDLGIWFVLFHSTAFLTGFSPEVISNFLPLCLFDPETHDTSEPSQQHSYFPLCFI